MAISVRQLAGAVVGSFCLGALVAPVATQVQGGGQAAPATAPAAAKQPAFMMVEFMKVSDGKEAEWVKLERETWKPMHMLRVKDGSILSWAAVVQAVPGDQSNGPVAATVTTFRGWPDPTKTNWEDLYKRAHPGGDINAMMQQTGRARDIVRTEIWQVLDQTEPAMGTN